MLDPVVDFMVRGAIALLLVTAAWHKLRDPISFWQVLAAYHLLPEATARPVSRLVPVIELVIAVALLGLPGSTLPIIAAIGLWLVYGAAMGINLLRGHTQLDCGCGGVAADQTIRWALVWRNVVLASVTALLLLPVTTRGILWLDITTSLFGGLMLVLLYAASDHLLRNNALFFEEEARP